MLSTLFLKGWLIGFSIAMPLGPIGILCLQYSLVRGITYGIAAGLGVALADALYGAITGYGISMISNLLIAHQVWMQLAGTLFLVYLGIKIFSSEPYLTNQNQTQLSLFSVFLTMFILTLTNPMTMLCFAGAFVGLGICGGDFDTSGTWMVTSGILIGSAVWWLILSCGVSLLGKTLQGKPLLWINRILGLAIFGFALALAVSSFYSLYTRVSS